MKRNVFLFAIIILAYGLLYWLKLANVLTLDNISIIYSDLAKGNSSVAAKIFEQSHKYWVAGLLFSMVSALLKVMFWALVIYVGFYLTQKQSFKPIVEAVALSELVNIAMNATQLTDFVFFNPPTSVAELSMAPLSLAGLFDVSRLDPWMVVPLSAANLFELAYVLVLSLLLSRRLSVGCGYACKVVLSSYGLVALLLVTISTLVTVYATK